MYSTTAYIYQQKTSVLTIDTTDGTIFSLRYDPMYAKRLTINKGVDNIILFSFINQDEKPVNITGSSMVFRMVGQKGTGLLVEKGMVILNAQHGQAKVTLSTSDLDNVLAQPANYSITRASGNLNEAVFTDAQSGGQAPVDIVDSVFPKFVPSSELTIPDTDLTAQSGTVGGNSGVYPDWALQAGQPINTYSPLQTTEYYSSFIEPTAAVTTLQMDLVGYTGTIKVKAATTYQSVWYDVTGSTDYLNKTGTIYINVLGWHPLLRLCFNNSVWTTGLNGNMILGQPAQATAQVSNGVVTGLTLTQPGKGYQAAPLIKIVGDGAGATATATVVNGVVSGITLVTGGSGYRPIPPTMTAATVIISTGRVENILYR